MTNRDAVACDALLIALGLVWTGVVCLSRFDYLTLPAG